VLEIKVIELELTAAGVAPNMLRPVTLIAPLFDVNELIPPIVDAVPVIPPVAFTVDTPDPVLIVKPDIID